MSKFIFSLESRNKLIAYGQSIESSSFRAQCFHLADLKNDLSIDDLSIADAISRDHSQHASALRAARIAVNAGVAREINATECCFGTFIFEDDSELK